MRNLKKELPQTMVRSLLFSIVALLLLLNIFVTSISAQETTVSVIFVDTGTSSFTIGEEGVPVNSTNPTQPFTVNINIGNVNDLYTWGFKLYFDNAILNCTADMVWLPSDHVFSYTTNYYETGPFVEFDPSEPRATVTYGITLIGEEAMFTGSGTLCQINFTGVAPGSTTLEFSRPIGPEGYTSLYSYVGDGTPTYPPIDFDVNDGNVTVIPEFPTLAIIPLFIISTLVIVITAARTRSKKPRRTIITQ